MARSPPRVCCGAGFWRRPRLVRQERALYGCPRYPFPTLKLVTLAARRRPSRGVDTTTRSTSTGSRSSESPLVSPSGPPAVRGWALEELARVSSASRTHADALRLMAMFLAHWDNKPENQRLVCLSGPPGATADARGRSRCSRTSAARSGRARWTWTGGQWADLDGSAARSEHGEMPHDGATFVTGTIPRRADSFWRRADACSAIARFRHYFSRRPLRPELRRAANGPRCSSRACRAIAEGPSCA